MPVATIPELSNRSETAFVRVALLPDFGLVPHRILQIIRAYLSIRSITGGVDPGETALVRVYTDIYLIWFLNTTCIGSQLMWHNKLHRLLQ